MNAAMSTMPTGRAIGHSATQKLKPAVADCQTILTQVKDSVGRGSRKICGESVPKSLPAAQFVRNIRIGTRKMLPETTANATGVRRVLHVRMAGSHFFVEVGLQ